MMGGVIVFRRVLVRRRVAAADVTAFEAQSQVHPSIAGGETFFAAVRRGRFAIELLRSDRAQVLAGDWRHGTNQITKLN